MVRTLLLCETLLATLVLAGCREAVELVPAAPQPVSYVSLELSQPGTGNRLTGTVESWKREEIGFEVAGRVLRIVEPGVDIDGRTFDEEGKLLAQGTVIAEMDSQRYVIARKQAQTASDVARTDLEELIPPMLAEAQAALELADTELQRYTRLVEKESAPQQRLDVAVTAQKAATAKVAQVVALRATKAALVNSSQANVEQADVNIVDCELTSPFTGQIARVHVIPGGYALPGQPVVTVQMMDPMKIQVAVSPETDKKVNFNDRVRVYLPDSEQSVEGYVYLKDTYADPATRTYLITLLVRNQKMVTGIPDELKDSDVATTQKLWTLIPEKVGVPGNYFIEVNALHQDDEGFFVWKVDNLTAEQLYETYDPVLQVSKARVKPGDGRLPALQVFTFRELVDYGDLDPDTDVIVGDLNGEIQDGKVVVIQQRWQLRPGDLAEVSLRGEGRPAGFYVPRMAILNDGEGDYLFKVSAGSDTAKRVNVRALETAGQTQRVEAISDDPFEPNERVIVGGAHYVMDGQQVSLVQELESQL
jgi:multidrug efflux pump subunit AcrA (membrane-fusion protein)